MQLRDGASTSASKSSLQHQNVIAASGQQPRETAKEHQHRQWMSQGMIVRPLPLPRTWRPPQCLHTPIRAAFLRPFHASACHHDDSALQNHYDTLGVSPKATAAEIKKQFYKLSKSHHPDLHPEDKNASQKFVQISEAYATLGSEEKRGRYDRDFMRSHSQNAPGAPQTGSYSSHAGSRPASGLSRRRTQFRGPPPSFYRSGGWGQQGEKRAENASKSSHSHEAQGNAQSNAQSNNHDTAAGTGPGGFTAGFDNDVPHFDQQGHYQTHSTIEKTRHKARRKRQTGFDGLEDLDLPGSGAAPSVLFNFFVMCGALSIIFGVTSVLTGGIGSGSKTARKKEEA